MQDVTGSIPVSSTTSGSSSVGRARPCQDRGREFEPRLPLHKPLKHCRRCAWLVIMITRFDSGRRLKRTLMVEVQNWSRLVPPTKSECSSFGRAPSFQVGGGRFEPCYSLILSFSITVVHVVLVHVVGVRIPEGQLKFFNYVFLFSRFLCPLLFLSIDKKI